MNCCDPLASTVAAIKKLGNTDPSEAIHERIVSLSSLHPASSAKCLFE